MLFPEALIDTEDKRLTNFLSKLREFCTFCWHAHQSWREKCPIPFLPEKNHNEGVWSAEVTWTNIGKRDIKSGSYLRKSRALEEPVDGRGGLAGCATVQDKALSNLAHRLARWHLLIEGHPALFFRVRSIDASMQEDNEAHQWEKHDHHLHGGTIKQYWQPGKCHTRYNQRSTKVSVLFQCSRNIAFLM